MLEGVKVLSFTHYLQGPSAAQALADLGADVVKVESCRGAYERGWSGCNTYKNGVSVFYLMANRNQRGVALDLKSDEGRETIYRLVRDKGYDVILENFRPGVMDKLGLGYEDMKNLKIRTMENDLHIAAFNAMGAIATPMASGDVFTGLQQGTIDAAENAIANLIANRYYEITKNVTWTNHVFGYMGVFMSDKAWNQIPDDLREDFVEGVKAGAQRQRDYLVEANEAAVKELTELGVEFYEIPIDDMRKLVEPAMEQFSDRMDPAWVEAIEAEK